MPKCNWVLDTILAPGLNMVCLRCKGLPEKPDGWSAGRFGRRDPNKDKEDWLK